MTWNSDMGAAPRDGTKVDLWAVFTDCRGEEEGRRYVDGRWYEADGDAGEGWHDCFGNLIDWKANTADGYHPRFGSRVTHWMHSPLPPAPETAEAGREG